MLDRTEAPQIQEGYGISVAFACLIEVVRSIALIVGGPDYLQESMTDLGYYHKFHCNIFLTEFSII